MSFYLNHQTINSVFVYMCICECAVYTARQNNLKFNKKKN